MKKNIITLLVCLAFIGCKKDQQCICGVQTDIKSNSGQYQTSSYQQTLVVKNTTKNKAEAGECSSTITVNTFSTTTNTVTKTCVLK